MSSTFYLETYGCSLNKADSDIIVGRLHDIGLSRNETPNDADLIIVNTCGVKEPTEDRAIHRITELTQIGRPIVVTGCLPRISLPRLKSAVPSFAAILGPQSIDSLGAVILRVLKGERGIMHLDSDQSSKLQFFEGPPETVVCTVPICEGCLGHCTYCAVRTARGEVRSYSIDEITEVVRRCTHLGYREIRLTSQDSGAFGADSGETLVQLLKRLDTIPGEHMFRLGMFNPDLVIDSLSSMLDVMKSNHFFRFFHAPLQSGSDRVLESMGRKYSLNEWLQVVTDIRGRFPDSTIATDIIVGFPGETEDDFDQTVELISRVRPEVVNISKYGDRPGTIASKSKDKVDTEVKKDRSRRLSRLVWDQATEMNKAWIGRAVEVLVTEGAPKGGLLCRTKSYKPVIVHSDLNLGETLEVTISSAEKSHLTGTVNP
ncbi:MAG: tRNA (N(6)-L-threonylcarbamoyladenosine(37)-C(2))-methylthiotransferase [Candidatus Thorarchaeota archaeon]|nr:MAG: tRNA (N(6)-L-threonylcarbamoyladenosine(37)-C(2))-methylthiotransferase [Candidatus Thorarchaeota archaeon]